MRVERGHNIAQLKLRAPIKGISRDQKHFLHSRLQVHCEITKNNSTTMENRFVVGDFSPCERISRNHWNEDKWFVVGPVIEIETLPGQDVGDVPRIKIHQFIRTKLLGEKVEDWLEPLWDKAIASEKYRPDRHLRKENDLLKERIILNKSFLAGNIEEAATMRQMEVLNNQLLMVHELEEAEENNATMGEGEIDHFAASSKEGDNVSAICSRSKSSLHEKFYHFYDYKNDHEMATILVNYDLSLRVTEPGFIEDCIRGCSGIWNDLCGIKRKFVTFVPESGPMPTIGTLNFWIDFFFGRFATRGLPLIIGEDERTDPSDIDSEDSWICEPQRVATLRRQVQGDAKVYQRWWTQCGCSACEKQRLKESFTTETCETASNTTSTSTYSPRSSDSERAPLWSLEYANCGVQQPTRPPFLTSNWPHPSPPIPITGGGGHSPNFEQVTELMSPDELPRPLDLNRRISTLSTEEREFRRDLRLDMSRLFLDRWVAYHLFEIDYEPMNMLITSARLGISNPYTRRYGTITTQLRAMSFENRINDDKDPTEGEFINAFEELHEEFYDENLDSRWARCSRHTQQEHEDIWDPCILCGFANPVPHTHNHGQRLQDAGARRPLDSTGMTIVPSPDGLDSGENGDAEDNDFGWTQWNGMMMTVDHQDHQDNFSESDQDIDRN